MSKILSPVLHQIQPQLVAHWCPGCQQRHLIDLTRWQLVPPGDVACPTFSPSILIDQAVNCAGGGSVRCHYFLRAGWIEFLADCTHPLRGQRVPLPAL